MTLGAIRTLIFCLSLLAHAEEPSEAPWDPDLDEESHVEFSGPFGRIKNEFGLYHQRFGGLPSYLNRTSFELEGALTWDDLSLKIVPWITLHHPYASGGDRRDFRSFVDAKEGWVDYANDFFEVRVGNQIYSWGKADRINPTDVINPTDSYDPLLTRKLPLFSGRLLIHPPEWDTVDIEIIGTPFFRASRLPLEIPASDPIRVNLDDSRWFLLLPTRIQVSNVDFPLRYELTPASAPAAWQAGTKVNLTDVDGWDFSFSTFHGVEKEPRIAVTRRGDATDPDLPIVLTLHPSYHRYHMVGADGSTTLNLWEQEFGFRFETAYNHRDNSRAKSLREDLRKDLTKDPYLHGVVGLDYTVPTHVLWTTMYLNLQYVHYHTFEREEEAAGAKIVSGLPNLFPFDQNVVLFVQNRYKEDVRFSQGLVTSLKNADFFYSPGVTLTSLMENLELSLEGQFFLGDRKGFMGQLKENSRTLLTASYSF